MTLGRLLLSFVVAARNDDYGVGFLDRMHAFVHGLCDGAAAVGLDAAELVVVEWNPPVDRLPLGDVLAWPDACPLELTVVTVPPDVHAKQQNADRIALFEYMAKNVGIRRARGEAVLVTNPDIVFSPDLLAWLARGNKAKDAVYRLDRHDVREGTLPDLETVRGRDLAAALQPHLFELRGMHLRGLCSRLGIPLQVASGTQATLRSPYDGEPFAKAHIWHSETAGIGMCLVAPTRVDEYWRVVGALGARPEAERGSEAAADARPVASCGELHLMAPGDFVLMSKNAWMSMRGYPEFPSSSSIDSYLIMMAVANGMRQVVLEPPHVIYHVDHDRSEQLARPRTPWGGFEETCVRDFLRHAMVGNGLEWGMRDLSLPEQRRGGRT